VNDVSLILKAIDSQQKHAEAKPRLLEGYEGMKQHAAEIPVRARLAHLTQPLERLVRLYDATGRRDRANKERKKLEEAKGGLPELSR
jgi:hypothetical protein